MIDFNIFKQDCLKANLELKSYIDNNLTKNDLDFDGSIGAGGDKSLNIDLIAEDIFIKHLLKYADIYSEESGLIKSNSKLKIKNSILIIDPLDGSDNFASGLPYYGTSVALKINDEVKVGIIFNLITGKSYVTSNIKYKNYSQKPKVGIFERAYKYPEICQKLYKNEIKWRSLGAIALSLADARNYKFVLFGGKRREFDLVAGLKLCDGLNIYKSDKFLLVCANDVIFNEIKEIIKEN